MTTHPHAGWSRAFTLVEVLAVLVLFGLITGMVVMNHDALLPSLRSESPESILRQSIRESVRLAAGTGRRIEVRFDEVTARTIVSDDSGRILSEHTCGKAGEICVRFLGTNAMGADAACEPMPNLRFSPTGHCGPFCIELEQKGRTRCFDGDSFSGLLTERKGKGIVP